MPELETSAGAAAQATVSMTYGMAIAALEILKDNLSTKSENTLRELGSVEGISFLIELFLKLSLIVESAKKSFMTCITCPEQNSCPMYPFHRSIFDHCVSIINTISTLESHLNPLFRAYAESVANKTQLAADQKKHVEELKAKELEYLKKCSALQKNLEITEAQKTGAVAALEELEQKTQSILGANRVKISQHFKAITELNKKISQYERSQAKSVSQKNQPTQKILDDLRAEMNKLKKNNSQEQQALEALQKQVKILTAENADLKRQNKALREKLTASNQAHEKASAAATQALAEKDAQIAAVQAKLDQVRQQMTEISAGRNQDRETFSQQLADQATQAHRIAELQTAYADLQRANAQLTAQSQGLLTANGSLYEANGHLVAQVQQMQGYIAHLQQYLYEQQGPAIPLGYAQPQPDARFGYSANPMGLFCEAGGPAGRGNAQAGQHVPTQHANR